jgi:hypothetical protein
MGTFYGQVMYSIGRRLPYWQIAALTLVAALWGAVSILWILARGDVESYLLSALNGSVRADAFVRLNPTFVVMWVGHTCFLSFGIVAMLVRNCDLFTVLIVGLILALLVAVTSQHWADPDWNVFAGVCFIGWIAGIISGAVYCLYWAVCSARRTRG